MTEHEPLRDRLLAACHDANAHTDEIVRAAVDLILVVVFTSSDDENAAVRDIARVAREMNEHARTSYLELHRSLDEAAPRSAA
jgi:hypothetical protein